MRDVASLSVIIPAYNEEGALNDALDEVVSELDLLGVIFEVIVVDDGSSDGSAEILTRRSLAEPRIKLYSHAENLGKGSALRTGVAAASHEWILFIDADLQIPLAEFASFMDVSAEADLLIGYRRDKHYTLYRKAVSAINRFMVQCLFGIRTRDVTCPFKLFRRDLLPTMQFKAKGFGIDAELLWGFTQSGARIMELPVVSLPRRSGKSKVTPGVLFSCVRELIQLRCMCEK